MSIQSLMNFAFSNKNGELILKPYLDRSVANLLNGMLLQLNPCGQLDIRQN